MGRASKGAGDTGKAQEVDCEVNQNWTAVYQLIARRMLKYLEDSDALKVRTATP